jgi:hypothetical protein
MYWRNNRRVSYIFFNDLENVINARSDGERNSSFCDVGDQGSNWDRFFLEPLDRFLVTVHRLRNLSQRQSRDYC